MSNTIMTRIKNKSDTYSEWYSKNPQLLDGELAVVVVPAETGAVVQEPAILIKVGDGTKSFRDLPFVSCYAADVYPWAKAENKPAYSANEITGIDGYIANYVNEQMGISVDTDTQYQIVKVDDYNYKLQSKGKSDSAWADVPNGVIAIPKYDDTGLISRVSNNEAAIEALNGDASVVGSVAKAVADAIAALTVDDVGGLGDALSNKVDSVAFETFKTDINNKANEHDLAIETINGTGAGSITKAAGDAEASARAYTDEKIALLMNNSSEAIDSVMELADAMANNEDAIDALTEVAGTKAAKSDLEAAVGRIDTLENEMDTAQSDIEALEAAVGTKAEQSDLNSLSDVAKSGNIDDLTQTDGTYVIFNCGTASTVI